jgi:MFS family permease
MRGLPRTFWYLWTGALINRLGAFVFTYLAIYLTNARHFSVATAGFVVSLWGVGGIASGPVGGILADRLGRRRTMLLGFLLGALAMVQLGLARAPWHIALSTMLLGFCNDLYRPAQQATIADIVPASERTRAYGYLYWAVNLGFAGAAALAGLVASLSFTWLFIIDAATTAIFGVIVYVRVPETHPERHVKERRHVPILAPFSDHVLLAFMATQFLMVIVFAQTGASLPMDMTARHIAPATYGSLVALNGVLICLLQPPTISIVSRHPRARMLSLGALCVGVGFGLCAVAHTPAFYAFTIVVWTLGELMFSPVTPTVLADLAPPHLRGSYQGAYQMVWGGASFVAPALGSLVLGKLSSAVLWTGCFVLAGMAALLHLVIAPARRRRLIAMHGECDREDGVRPRGHAARVAPPT